VTALWFDAMWADVGGMWPEMAPIVGQDEAAFVKACLEQGIFKPVDQAAQRAAWTSVYAHASAWSRFLHDHPIILAPVCCERPWVVNEDVSDTCQ